MEIKTLLDQIQQLAKEKGFGTAPEDINLPEKIALLHSEISEAYEAYRKKNIDGEHGFKEELADVLIRILHLCVIYNIDIETLLKKKMDKNASRTWDWDKLNETHT
jgi:NTP pyrophosphatase (non-canonical NTP hydrolase)